MKYEEGDIVRISFPDMEGVRGRVAEVLGTGTYVVAYESGLADVYAGGWLELAEEAQ